MPYNQRKVAIFDVFRRIYGIDGEGGVTLTKKGLGCPHWKTVHHSGGSNQLNLSLKILTAFWEPLSPYFAASSVLYEARLWSASHPRPYL